MNDDKFGEGVVAGFFFMAILALAALPATLRRQRQPSRVDDVRLRKDLRRRASRAGVAQGDEALAVET
jgi:hypothetical protein